MSIDQTEYPIHDHVSADTLEVGDQTLIDGDAVIILTVDKDREDIDEVYVTFENLTGISDDAALFADDVYPLWSH